MLINKQQKGRGFGWTGKMEDGRQRREDGNGWMDKIAPPFSPCLFTPKTNINFESGEIFFADCLQKRIICMRFGLIKSKLMRWMVFIFLLVSVKSFCQCPQWIGSSIENAKVLRATIQKHMNVKLKEVTDTADDKQYKLIEYRDDKGLTSFKMGWYAKKKQQGSSWVHLPAVITDITIKGPADKIDKLLEDLNNQATNCLAHSKDNKTTKFSNYIMSWDRAPDAGGIAMKYISIKAITQGK